MAKYLKLYNNLKEKIDKILLNSNEIINAPYINLTNNDGHVYFSEIIENKRFYDKLDYEEVEYLENTSIAYIDTGLWIYYDSSESVTYETEILYTEIPNEKRQLNGSNGYAFYGITTDGHFECGGVTSSNAQIQQNVWHTQKFVVSKSGTKLNCYYYVNNEQVLSRVNQFTTNTYCYPIDIFGLGENYDANYTNYAVKAKIKYYKIWFGNNLVRDFVPVKQISTGKYGLFDKIENKFYSSENSIDFIGGELTGINYIATQFTDSYIETEYIENRVINTAFINTYIKPTANLGVEIKVRAAYDGTNISKESIFFGASKNAAYKSGNNFCIEKSSENGISGIAFNMASSGTTSIGTYSNYANPFIILFNYNGDKIAIVYNQNRVEQFRKTLTVSTIPTDLNLYLFCRSINGSQDPSYSYPVRIYYCKLWRGTTLVRDFVPVIRIRDKKYGLYDKVEGKFYDSPNQKAFYGSTNYITDSQGNYITYQENNNL